MLRPLRNSNYKLLTLPTINRKQHACCQRHGGRAFRYMAASTWNNFQTIYGNQPYIEEAIYLKITLRNMFI